MKQNILLVIYHILYTWHSVQSILVILATQEDARALTFDNAEAAFNQSTGTQIFFKTI